MARLIDLVLEASTYSGSAALLDGAALLGERSVAMRGREHEALTIDDVRPQLLSRGVSDREADVVAGVLQGMRNAQIASQLFISEYTVKDHLKHVFQKLGVDSRGGLIHALYAAPGPLNGARRANAGASPS